MMTQIVEIAAGLMVVIGALFAISAGLGVLRFPDVYSRMHAASKAGTVGSGFILLALAITTPDVGVATRAITGFVFFLLTAPIAAHLLAKVAYETGVPMWDSSKMDEMPKSK